MKTLFSHLSRLSLLPLFAFSTVNCTAGSAGEGKEEPLGKTQQAFTGRIVDTAIASGVPVGHTYTVSFGTQGFISTVVGNFAQSSDTPSVSASVVDSSEFGSLFSVYAFPGSSTGTIGGTGWAVYPGDNTTPGASCAHSGRGAQIVPLTPPSVPNWICFINRLSNTLGSSFSGFADLVLITYDDAGNPSLTCSNNSEASAQCVPITAYLGAVGQGGSDTFTTDLGPVDDVNGKTCLLYGVGGSFRTDDANAGVLAFTSGGEWFITTTPFKVGYVACVY